MTKEQQENINKFLGLDGVFSRLRRLEQLFGIRKTEPLKQFANNAAAITAGLKVGQSYVTPAGNLMIVQP